MTVVKSFQLIFLACSVLSIPILVLWNTKISSRKKIILISIFSATTLIMVVAIIRVVVDTTYDREINIAWLCFWSFVEVDTGVSGFPLICHSVLMLNAQPSLSLVLPPSGSSSSPPKAGPPLVGQLIRLHTLRCCKITRLHIANRCPGLSGTSSHLFSCLSGQRLVIRC
jgi:hypothetical protein